ncbi:hypothetical protein CNR22_00110 [Sphingobacteriaceae bacterium]|nr:hypothetical protein CNR22_00110 [Sphingobacteriaceae bacterium]
MSAVAQVSPSYTAIAGSVQGVNGGGTNFATTTINFPVTDKPGSPSVLRERKKSAKLYFKLDLGNSYVKQTTGWNFKVVVNLSYKFGTNSPTSKTFSITTNEPEVLKIDDVLPSFASVSDPFYATVNSVTINDGNSTPANLTGLIKNYVEQNLRLSITLARQYDVDVRLASAFMPAVGPIPLPVSIAGRLVTFSWQPNNSVASYPNYELQILKLENRDDTYKNDQDKISTSIDWSKALRVETQSPETSIDLTVAEGTGFYIWRVRPIGNYFDGGIANSENYGEWSATVTNPATNLILDKTNHSPSSSSDPHIFYFIDPDKDFNWIYSRVFTEGDNNSLSNPTGVKTSEGISYADGLLNARQNQKYNSSENTNIVSQTLLDYSGRPAMVTMPVPVAGGLSGYKTGFVKNQSGDLYTAEQFDADSKLSDPDKVEDATSAYKYYSDQATTSPINSNVASAEGYPFKRTVFESDGSGRVREESGVGKAHSLGTQVTGQGRTLRMQYGTASDDELIWLFGEEAPLGKSVIKTITTDQNNVQSITYTSKEGHTIATALMSYSTAELSALSNPTTSLIIKNEINENVFTSDKITSSKRIAIPTDNTTLTLSYVKENISSGSAGCVSGDCNLRMRFILVDLDRSITYISDASSLTPQFENFISTPSFTFPSSWRFASTGTAPVYIYPTGSLGAVNQITLNAGSYMLVKEMFSANSAKYADSLLIVENEKTRIVYETLIEKMQDVNSPATYTAFTAFMSTLTAMVNNYNSVTPSPTVTSSDLMLFLEIDPSDVPPGFQFPHAADFDLQSISTSTDNPSTSDIQISSSCCGTIKVPIPKKPACYICEGSPEIAYANSNTLTISSMTLANANATVGAIIPYGVDDFKDNNNWSAASTDEKRAAVGTVVEREFITPLKDRMTAEGMNPATDLWKIAPGFNYSSLNFMITNMLISQYYTGSAMQHTNGTWYAATKDASGSYSLTVPVTSLVNEYNYPCKGVYESWTQSVDLFNAYEASEDGDAINVYNDNDGSNSAQDNGDDDDNWDMKNGLMKKWLKKKISQEMNEFKGKKEAEVSQSRQEAATSLPATFLTLAPPQYAAIIDGSDLATHISSLGGIYPDEYLYSYPTAPHDGSPSIYTTVVTNAANTTSLNHLYAPLLFSVNPSGNPVLKTYTCNSVSNYELYYPYVIKPEWMFKYFVYNVFENGSTSGFRSDFDVLLPHQVNLDLLYKYNNPISYLSSSITLSTGLCDELPVSTYSSSAASFTVEYTHRNWTSSERKTFYSNIAGAPKCYANKGVDATISKDNYFEPTGQLPTCASKTELINQAVIHLEEHIAALKDKANAFRESIVNELISSCYTIVPCKTGPGQITDKEIDIMVKAVVASATAQVNAIKNSVLSITVVPSNSVACSVPPSFTTTSYFDGLCNLPACSQTDCKLIVYYNDNSLNIVDSRKILIRFFAECDQMLLNMMETGSFLPYIPPYGACSGKPAKEWRNGSCTEPSPTAPCTYGEKTGCPTTQFRTYSKTYPVTATGN